MYEKIVVPLDGSELAELALPYAEELAGRVGSEVTLLHVYETTGERFRHLYQSYMQQMVGNTKEGAERYLEGSEKKAIKVKSIILTGNPAEEIVDYADRENVGLIAMATHGHSGIRRWAMGSVIDKVLQATKQPVVLVKAENARLDVREKGILRRALVPLDGSQEGEAVIPYIEELASKLAAELVLLYFVSTD